MSRYRSVNVSRHGFCVNVQDGPDAMYVDVKVLQPSSEKDLTGLGSVSTKTCSEVRRLQACMKPVWKEAVQGHGQFEDENALLLVSKHWTVEALSPIVSVSTGYAMAMRSGVPRRSFLVICGSLSLQLRRMLKVERGVFVVLFRVGWCLVSSSVPRAHQDPSISHPCGFTTDVIDRDDILK